jgi:hypothetical protein
MPLAPPVMTATFPSSFPMLSSWTPHERDAYLPTVAAAEQDGARCAVTRMQAVASRSSTRSVVITTP